MITLFLTWRAAASVPDGEAGRIAERLRTLPGLTRGLVFTAAAASDPFLNDGPPPPLALQLYFADIAALEAACGRSGALQALADPTALPSLASAVVTQQAMLARPYPVDDAAIAGEPWCSYLVAYPGPAADFNLWLDFYLAHHPGIMRRFPGIREIEICTRLDWISFLPFGRDDAMQRNKVVFDSPAALDAALNSPVRNEMRSDFHRFPPFAGGSTHYPMLTRGIVP